MNKREKAIEEYLNRIRNPKKEEEKKEVVEIEINEEEDFYMLEEVE